MTEVPRRRRSDRWQQWTSITFMIITGLAGTIVLVLEIGVAAAQVLGFAEGEGGLWGLGSSVLWSAALFLSSAAYSAGSPVRTGQAMLDALVSKVGGANVNYDRENR